MVVTVAVLAALLSLAAPADPSLAAPGSAIAPLSPPELSDVPARALDLSHHGHILDAWDLAVTELLGAVARQEWGGEREAASAEVIALVLDELTTDLGRWQETAEILAPSRPWPQATPPRVAFLLDRLLARSLRRIGKHEQARAIIDQQAYLVDFYLAGPFDNERGGGFDVAYPPEAAFDLHTPMQGKERPVTWRLNPGRQHPLARVDLGAVFQPSRQAVGYAATALSPLEPGPAVLRLGTAGPFKLFIDGHLVAENEAERPLRPDQERIVIDLHEGWNQLLLKLAVEDDDWDFEARLTDLEGRPLTSVEVRSAFCAWPGPAPHPDTIAWWEIEEAPWSVERLNGGPIGGHDDHDEHGHEEEDDDGLPGDGQGADGDGMPGDGQGSDDGGPPDDDGGWPGAAPAPVPDDWSWPVPRREVPLPTPAPEAVDVFGAPGADAGDLVLASLYHLLVHPDDRVDRTARRLAEAAVAQEDGDVLARYLVAVADVDSRSSANEREVNRRLHALEQVLAADPEHVAALLALAGFSRSENPLPDRADELTLRAVQAAPDDWRALTSRADLLDDRRRRGEAEVLRLRAEGVPEADVRPVMLAARALRSLRTGDRDLSGLWAAWRRDILRTTTTLELFGRLVDAGDHDAALYVIEKGLQADPFDLGLMRMAGRRLEHEPGVMVHRARELVGRALDVCPEHAGALADMVRIELLRGETDSAVVVLEELLRVAPNDEQAGRQLALLTREDREAFEEPWRWDAAELLDLPLPARESDPLEVLARTVVWRLHPDGTEHRYEHAALRVLTDAGARRLTDWALRAEPGSTLFVHQVRVIRADGTIENAPAPRRSVRGSRRYDLPPLSPGDVVDVEWREDQRVADVFGEYFGTRHLFYADRPDALAPTRRSELVIIAPPDVPLYVAEHHADALEREDSTDADGHRVIRWTTRGLKRPPVESAMPDRVELAPRVDVTTFRDWQAFARWYWGFIEKEFVTTDAMRAKVAELTDGLDTEAERIEAVARFVGQEIRYNAWPFGTHGYEPYSAATIFERRFGDCKDKSILLRQMLAEIDVEAWPVLIKAEWQRPDEPLEAAMVGHFNHCIAYLPATDEREGFYLDATADRNPVSYLRADDQGARVLHVTPDGGSVHDIPYAPPEQNQLTRRWEVALDATGAARVELVDESNGHYGVVLRSVFGGEQGDIAAMVGRMVSDSFGTVTVDEVQTSDLEDIGEPARMAVEFQAQDVWVPEGEARALPVTFDGLGLKGVAIESPKARRFELVLDRPFAHDTVIRYLLPEGAAPLELPEPVQVDEDGLMHYRLDVTPFDGGVEVRRRFELERRRIGLDDYERFREALRRVEQAESLTLRIRPGSPD